MRTITTVSIFIVVALILVAAAMPSSAQIVQSGNTTVDLSIMQRINPQPVEPVMDETDVELLTNAGFETGSLPPWTTNNWSVVTNGPHTGTYCAYDLGNYWIMQSITPTPAAQIVSATIWERQPEGQISAIDWMYQGGSYSEDLIWLTSSWAQYNIAQFIDPGTIVIGLRVWGYSGGGPLPDESFIDDISIQTASVPPNLNVTLGPIGPPIVIPAQGGSFSFNAGVVNMGPQVPFSVWGRIKDPNGTYTAPTLGPVTINPPLNINVTRLRTQTVPAGWAAGLYYYLGYANTSVSYPAIDADSFSWTKSTTADGGPIVWNAACTGELFPGEIATPVIRETFDGITEGAITFPGYDPYDNIDTTWFTGNIDQHIVGGQTISWTTDLPQVAATRLKIKYGLWNSPDVPLGIYVNNNYVGTVVADQGYISPGPEYAQFGIGNYIVSGPDLIEVRAEGTGEAVIGYVGAGYKSGLDVAGGGSFTMNLTPNPFNPTTTFNFTLPEAARK